MPGFCSEAEEVRSWLPRLRMTGLASGIYRTKVPTAYHAELAVQNSIQTDW